MNERWVRFGVWALIAVMCASAIVYVATHAALVESLVLKAFAEIVSHVAQGILSYLIIAMSLGLVWLLVTARYRHAINLLVLTTLPEEELTPLQPFVAHRGNGAVARAIYWIEYVLEVVVRLVRRLLFFHGLIFRPIVKTLVVLAYIPRPAGAPRRWAFPFVLNPDVLFARTRLWIELQILFGEPERDINHMTTYGRSIFPSLFAIVPVDRPHSADAVESLHRRLREDYYRLAAVFQSGEPVDGIADSSSVSAFETCFDLFDRKDRILRYFQALRRVAGPETPLRFSCPITIRTGFLAPNFLISGLLSEFDEDWKRVVGGYGADEKLLDCAADPLHDRPGLRQLQAFIWACWVQWGPSVPICSSDQWAGGAVACQYGYGDENNSLPVLVPHADFKRWRQKIESLLKVTDLPHADIPGIAWPVSIVNARLRWLTVADRRRELVGAQQRFSLAPGDDADWTHGLLVLDSPDSENAMARTDNAPRLYSAYVWCMIAICRRVDSDGASSDVAGESGGLELLLPDESELEAFFRPFHFPAGTNWRQDWRALIPFFQHGNIADGSVYEDIKTELAAKTVDTLLRQLAATREGPHRHLEFALVCSIDDNGDRSTVLAHAASAAMQGTSIRTRMQEALLSRLNSDPASQTLAHRLHLELTPAVMGLGITSCHLPEVVGSYLDHVGQVTQRTASLS